MPSTDGLTESGERILLALWKLNGIGKNYVSKNSLKTDLATGASDYRLTDEIVSLRNQGFLETATGDDDAISLTPLGLAILRQIEEDKLQELK